MEIEIKFKIKISCSEKKQNPEEEKFNDIVESYYESDGATSDEVYRDDDDPPPKIARYTEDDFSFGREKWQKNSENSMIILNIFGMI